MKMLSISIVQSLFLAQLGSDLSTKVGLAVKLLMLFGFLSGVVAVMSGAAAIRRGEDGKPAIVAGIILAAAPAIVAACYAIFIGPEFVPRF
jgi:hypothetical protein